MSTDKSTVAKTENPKAEGESTEEELSVGAKKAAHLRKYKARYTKTTSASGNASLHNGDDLATLLSGAEPNSVVTAAEKLLGFEAGELTAKYAKLNPGARRMNAGNRIRAAVRNEVVTLDEVAKAVLAS